MPIDLKVPVANFALRVTLIIIKQFVITGPNEYSDSYLEIVEYCCLYVIS